MYDFLDRPLTSLDHGGRFLVWSTRSWVQAAGNRKCPASVIARAFPNGTCFRDCSRSCA